MLIWINSRHRKREEREWTHTLNSRSRWRIHKKRRNTLAGSWLVGGCGDDVTVDDDVIVDDLPIKTSTEWQGAQSIAAYPSPPTSQLSYLLSQSPAFITGEWMVNWFNLIVIEFNVKCQLIRFNSSHFDGFVRFLLNWWLILIGYKFIQLNLIDLS